MLLKEETLHEYRQETFRTRPGTRVKKLNEAVEFVNQRGFIFFWPITGMVFPSLWTAVAGERPVADAHDDPGHVTWGWKDAMLGGREWYYAKVLRRKSTMISFEVLPYFYALSDNYGSPEEDYLSLYEMGRMTQEAKTIYEALLDEGPLDTIALRKKARMSSQSSESRFSRALADLQADFKILPVGVTQTGGWRYAFTYQIVARHYPDIDEWSRCIDEKTACLELTRKCFLSLGATRLEELRKLFAWRQPAIEWCLDSLEAEGFLQRGVSLEGKTGEVAALATLVDGQ